MKRFWCTISIFIFCLCRGALAAENTWQQLKEKHFIIYYRSRADHELASRVLRKAEEYYDKIGSQIGYTRYTDFWTWDERVRIFLFPDRVSFVESTGQPSWALGYADRESRLFKTRTIATYIQENDFIDGLLPHEISHLILFDYIPDATRVPVWLSEGFAQLQEKEKSAAAHNIMRVLSQGGQYIRLENFMNWDIRRVNDPRKVEIFYAQSLSLVEFLMSRYGRQSFERLFKGLRDGRSFMEALASATSQQVATLSDLEREWLQFIRKKSAF